MLAIYDTVRTQPMVISGLGLGLWASIGAYGYLSSQDALEKCRIVQSEWLESLAERKLKLESLSASSKNCKSPDEDGCNPEFIELIEYTLNEEIPELQKKALHDCDKEIHSADTFLSNYADSAIQTVLSIGLAALVSKLLPVAFSIFRRVV